MYKFDPTGQPVELAFRAIATDQLDEALADLDAGEAEARTLVHEGRRRCKKLRGLLRLVRPVFPDYAKENEALRAAAALLSHLRDAEVLKHTLSDLAKIEGNERLEALGAKVEQTDPPDQASVLAQFRERLAEIRQRAASWTIAAEGSDALLPGFKKTYRAARQRMRAAQDRGGPLRFHEWRKANKYHGFHIDLLKRAAPDVLAGPLDAVDQLSTLLGQHHDLAVLLETTDRTPEQFGDASDLAFLREAIGKRRGEIERDAFELGRQICAEKPKAITQRFAAYWKSAA
ncbi:MAG TPA: CHAD domain-containing protein [Devosia sp.]|nr:CHAD domain-containing protein [Devosia sp.]